MPSALAPLIRSSSPPRAFGNFALGRLLAKSELTMVWLAIDNRTGTEALLSMPRLAPTGASSIGNWLLTARRAARLDHPNIAKVAECGVQDHWPYVAVDRRAGMTLEEWLGQHPPPSVEDAAAWVAGVLRGLAFGHDAGIAHLDLQLHNILVNERGQASVMALAVAAPDPHDTVAPAPRSRDGRAAPIEPAALRAQRAAAERDVLACGVVLHRLLAGVAALDSNDVAAVIERMAPRGREFVRLPWTTPHPIAEPLRAIANRSTSAQVRLRYRNARTFSARSPAGSRRPQTTKAGRWRFSSTACAPSVTCLRCPAWRRECSASPRSRASEPTRSRATCCPTWRCRSSC